MLTLEQQAALVEEAPEISCRFLAAGENGTHAYALAAASEDGLTGALRTAWRRRIDRNTETGRKNPCGGARRSDR
jgi:hypothetical protein